MASPPSLSRILWPLILLLWASLLHPGEATRVKNKIYSNIQGDMACFKRFNGTHEIGCTSNFRGNYGVVHVVKAESDLKWLYERGPHHPYVIAITPDFLTQDKLEQARDSGKVSGVVVMVTPEFNPETDLLNGFSGEHKCPNEQLGLYNESSNPDYSGYCQKEPWNPLGTSLLYSSWEFPIFLVDNETSIEYIRTCYSVFNKPIDGEARDWPLCSMELKSNMFGTTNTEVCMRRRSLSSVFSMVNFCDPLYDFNIWGSLKPMNSSESLADKSVIVVATRMDAASMFDNISPGANSAVSGLVTLMVAAQALNSLRDEIIDASDHNNKNVLFVIFQGESWGYIGSSRIVWDMEKGEFPFKHQEDLDDQMTQINFTHIDYFIEISQVGKGFSSSQVFLHTDPISNSDPTIRHETDSLLEAFNISAKNVDGVKFTEVPRNKSVPLPPASFQSFLKHVNVSGLVIADHENKYKNPYYESIFDDYQNVKYEAGNETLDTDRYHQYISSVADVVASTLYFLLTARAKVVKADRTLTNDLLFCYMKNVSCKMFQEYGEKVERLVQPHFFNEKPAKMYTSVKSGESGRTYITHNIFASLLGEKVPLNESECKTDTFYQVSQYYYFATVDNGTCYRSTVRQTEAMSPAFLIEGYDWQSGEYSTWTESGWQLTKAMIFLQPSVAEEVALVCGGIASLVISSLLVYFMNARADLLFGLATPPAAC